MFSRVALRAGGLQPALKAQFLNRGAIVLSSRSTATDAWDKATKVYYGPERDTKNFPITKQGDTSPATRMGFIPEPWFQAFYDKTGVTGPYMFGTGALVFLLSKEYWVSEVVMTEFIGFWIAFYILAKKLGPGISKSMDGQVEAYRAKKWDEPLAATKASSQETIAALETAIEQQDGQKYMFEAKKENVDFQLEAIYRQRLNEVKTAVKKRLDYQMETENVQRTFQQSHMANWIVDNVLKGITPQQEKDSIAKCIQDLSNLAKKQNPATA